MDDSVYVFSMM